MAGGRQKGQPLEWNGAELQLEWKMENGEWGSRCLYSTSSATIPPFFFGCNSAYVWVPPPSGMQQQSLVTGD